MSASNLNTARPEWTAGQVAVNSATDFRLVLEGKASNGGFAIDQLVFTPGKCKSKCVTYYRQSSPYVHLGYQVFFGVN
jgi:hypothetical protein